MPSMMLGGKRETCYRGSCCVYTHASLSIRPLAINHAYNESALWDTALMTVIVFPQRVYGITFPDKKQLAEHLERLAEAKKRDHRVVGTQMELFMFDKLSPGSCFFMPNGACVYNALIEVRV